MRKKVGIVGGDFRIEKLVKMLVKDGFEIYTYCLENLKLKDFDKISNTKVNIRVCNSISELVVNSDIIITSIPLTKDGVYVYSEYSNMKVNIADIFTSLENIDDIIESNKTIYTTNISKEILNKFNTVETKVKIVDILKIEEFSVLNSIATAEGTLCVAIQNFEKNLQDSNILILGYGRTGKVIANKFKYLANNVACASKNNDELVWIKANGYTCIELENLKNNIDSYDIIINTIPAVILKKDELERISNETLVIDIASKPGGVDEEYIKEYNINYIQALGIPGKVSPVTSAEIIKNIILKD